MNKHVGMMKKQLLFLFVTLVLTMLIFITAKVVFMLCSLQEQAFSFGDVISVLMHGLSLDFSTSLYVISLPFLLCMFSVWFSIPQWIMKTYYVLVAVVMALAFVADTSLYAFWQFKLDASCLSYLETPTEAMASVTTGYLLTRVLVFILVTAGIYMLYAKSVSYLLPGENHRKTLRSRILQTILYVLLIPVVVIGIRGGLGASTTNIGQVYYSQNQFLNHSAVNPVFSFMASLEHLTTDLVTYDFMSEQYANQLVRNVFSTQSIGGDSLLNTQRPNVVVILLESCGSIFTALEGRPEIMPNLNHIAQEGISFSRCYANSFRTDRGTVCALSGYPGFPTMSVMKIPAKTRNMAGLARSLKSEGYATSYIYGGDINFTNMRSFLLSTGFEHITWQEDYSIEEQYSAKWGVRDDITFKTLTNEIKNRAAAGSPFFICYSTLSSHEPWDVPINELDDEIDNAFRYVDNCIGTFVNELKGTSAWKNLLVVMIPDHGINHMGLDEMNPARNHIPWIWTGGAVKAPREIETICAQSDMPATLLGQLGIQHDEYPFSRDVMSSTYNYPLAMHCYNNGFSIIDSTGFTVYDLDVKQVVFSTTTDSDGRVVMLGKAILQLTADDLNRR